VKSRKESSNKKSYTRKELKHFIHAYDVVHDYFYEVVIIYKFGFYDSKIFRIMEYGCFRREVENIGGC
jgi:hypothetical protein